MLNVDYGVKNEKQNRYPVFFQRHRMIYGHLPAFLHGMRNKGGISLFLMPQLSVVMRM